MTGKVKAGGPRRGIAAALLVALALPGMAMATPIERNPAPTGSQTRPVRLTAPPNVTPETADPTPIAGALRVIRFLGPKGGVLAPRRLGAGIHPGPLSALNDPAFVARMQPFLGRPISLRLIGRIEAAVADWYRRRGLPFVSVTTPPQEITGGVLQFRVTQFRLGHRSAAALGRMSPAEALAGVRVQPGQPIDTRQLGEDLDWLNRSPFRHVSATFRPGAGPGQTDLSLNVTETKPWRLILQADTSGARGTGRERFQLGAMVGDFWRPGSVLSYVFTGSPDAVQKGAALFGGHPDYASHALALRLPTGHRQELEISFDAVESNSASFPFDTRSRVTEGKIGYRLAASGLGLPSGSGDLFAGIELRHAVAQTRFAGALVTSHPADVAQLYLGWTREWLDARGIRSVRVAVRYSPGGASATNSGAAFSAYSGGRATNARYAYATLLLGRSLPIGGGALTSTLDAQWAGSALLDTEQMTLGGSGAVRGYLPDDGAFDSAAVWRNTLTGRARRLGRGATLAPFLSADLGYGLARGAGGGGQGMASLGIGARMELGQKVTASFSAAMALRDAAVTRNGDVGLQIRVRALF